MRKINEESLGKLETNLYEQIKEVIENSKRYAVSQVNQTMTLAYWRIGKLIRENILENKRADYGDETIKKLSESLTQEYGDGFSQRNLFRMAKFFEILPDLQILTTLSTKLSWSHFIEIIKIDDEIKRDFYLTMCSNEHERSLSAAKLSPVVRELHPNISDIFEIPKHLATSNFKIGRLI